MEGVEILIIAGETENYRICVITEGDVDIRYWDWEEKIWYRKKEDIGEIPMIEGCWNGGD